MSDHQDALTTFQTAIQAALNDYVSVVCFPDKPPDAPPLTTYWQRNPIWKDDKLGTGDTTIGRYGCVLCCMAMVADRAHDLPLMGLGVIRANRLVRNAGGFTGENGNLFRWATGGKALGLKCEWVEYWNYGVPADVERVIAAVEQGHYVLLKVDFDPQDARVNQHWVLVREYLGRSHIDADVFLIDDPWTGETHKLPPAYSRGGWTAENALFGAVAFSWDGE